MNFLRKVFRKLSSDIYTYVRTYIHTYRQTDRQTDRQTGRQADEHDKNYIPRRFAGGQKWPSDYGGRSKNSDKAFEVSTYIYGRPKKLTPIILSSPSSLSFLLLICMLIAFIRI